MFVTALHRLVITKERYDYYDLRNAVSKVTLSLCLHVWMVLEEVGAPRNAGIR